MPASHNLQQIAFLIILAVAFGLLIAERLRNDLVALLIVVSLYVTRVLDAEQALAGFSSEPAIVVVGIFVLSAALHHTGLSETIGRWIGRLAGSSFNRAIAVIMPSVALLSAFTHHLTTTAMMLPVTLNLAREREIPASKLLMPLSFAASLGTAITIIGAPAFLIASRVLQQAGRPGLGIFSIAPIGLAMSAVGTLYVLLVGRFLLPSRQGGEDPGQRFRLAQYFTELTILSDSPYLDKTIDEAEADDRYQFKVVGWVRKNHRISRPYGEERLKEGDVLLVRTMPEEIAAIRQDRRVELHPVAQYAEDTIASNGKEEDKDITERLVQAVIGPGSDLIGRTLREVDFRRRYGAIVVGLWRRAGSVQQELSKIRLRAGDVLVILGHEEALDRIANERSFLLLLPFQGEIRLRRKAPLAGAIMLATIVAAALNWLSIEMAALAGAIAVVMTGCITPRQAYRGIDPRIFVFIAGAIPLGAAMEATGTSQLLAGGLQAVVGNWSPALILMSLFAAVAVLTQLMSDAATTALLAPVAVALAAGLGHAPEPYVVTVAMSAVVSFLTPIGHHGNLLVYGPGRYEFSDFVRVGTPLTILVALVVVFLAPLLWPT